MLISSIQNPMLKELKKLHEASYRKKKESFLIEGAKEISLALKNNIVFEKTIYCPSLLNQAEILLLEQTPLRNNLFEVSEKLMRKISYRQNPDGLLVLAQKPSPLHLSQIASLPQSLFIILESLEKPGNIGAICRVADAVKVSAIFICNPITDIYNPNVIRASMGTVFTTPIVIIKAQELLLWLKEKNIQVIATSPSAVKLYTEIDYKKASAILIGSEKDGLSSYWLSDSIEKVKIPMKGQTDSLNAATSAAIVLYEALKQKS